MQADDFWRIRRFVDVAVHGFANIGAQRFHGVRPGVDAKARGGSGESAIRRVLTHFENYFAPRWMMTGAGISIVKLAGAWPSRPNSREGGRGARAPVPPARHGGIPALIFILHATPVSPGGETNPMIDHGTNGNTMMARLGQGLRRLTPMAYRLQRTTRQIARRAMRKPRTVLESPNLLPLLIQVLAAFSKVDGVVLEEEIDSSLGFLRYDYPEAVYSELRKLFRQALNEQHDLMAMAQKLSTQLTEERKIMLGVQLYDLISKTDTNRDQITAFYAFMSALGMAAQAIDIVYQLNAAEDVDPAIFQRGSSPLESLCFGRNGNADVVLRDLEPGERLLVFRYHDVILLKNQTRRPINARGRPLAVGHFCRVYSGQRIVLGEQVLAYQDLVYYFNAKKNVSMTNIYLELKQNEVEMEKQRTRDSAIEVQFGLKVKIRALKNVEAVLNGVALKAGAHVEATLEDKILFDDHSSSRWPICAAGRGRSGADSSSRRTRTSIWSRTIRVCSRKTTSCSRRVRAGRCC